MLVRRRFLRAEVGGGAGGFLGKEVERGEVWAG